MALEQDSARRRITGGLAHPNVGHYNQPDNALQDTVLRLTQADQDESFMDFVGTTAADSSASISTSTAEAGAKFGAIRVEINGVHKWIRVYDSAV